jgi:hypothetical protein
MTLSGKASLVTYGRYGEAIVNIKSDVNYYKFNGKTYSRAGSIHDPLGNKQQGLMALSDTTIYVQHEKDTPTHHFSTKKCEQRDMKVRKGILIGFLPESTLVFCQAKMFGGFSVALELEDSCMQLKPPVLRSWSHHISVCKTHYYYVVVERLSQRLDVFDHQGRSTL